jgi:hypothetical protein
MLVRDVSGFVLHAGTEGQEGLPSVADDQPQAISLLIIKSVFDLAARGRGLPDDALRSGRAGKSKTNWTKPPGALPAYGNCMG